LSANFVSARYDVILTALPGSAPSGEVSVSSRFHRSAKLRPGTRKALFFTGFSYKMEYNTKPAAFFKSRIMPVKNSLNNRKELTADA